MASGKPPATVLYPKGMPGPERIARKSIAVCIRLGFTRKEAAMVIMTVAEQVSLNVFGMGMPPESWVEAVHAEAVRVYETS